MSPAFMQAYSHVHITAPGVTSHAQTACLKVVQDQRGHFDRVFLGTKGWRRQSLGTVWILVQRTLVQILSFSPSRTTNHWSFSGHIMTTCG